MVKRKCKKCGRIFDHKLSVDGFCSELCRMTGYFVKGGGDTSKPGVVEKKVEAPKKIPSLPKGSSERFERVKHMFTLPLSERWAIAKDFTDEERAYARRMAKSILMADYRFTKEWDWSSDEDKESVVPEIGDVMSGESDDGTI